MSKLTKTFQNITHTSGQYSIFFGTVLFQCIPAETKKKNAIKNFQAGQSAVNKFFTQYHNFRRIYSSKPQIPIHGNVSYISPPIRTTDGRSVETP